MHQISDCAKDGPGLALNLVNFLSVFRLIEKGGSSRQLLNREQFVCLGFFFNVPLRTFMEGCKFKPVLGTYSL